MKRVRVLMCVLFAVLAIVLVGTTGLVTEGYAGDQHPYWSLHKLVTPVDSTTSPLAEFVRVHTRTPCDRTCMRDMATSFCSGNVFVDEADTPSGTNFVIGCRNSGGVGVVVDSDGRYVGRVTSDAVILQN